MKSFEYIKKSALEEVSKLPLSILSKDRVLTFDQEERLLIGLAKIVAVIQEDMESLKPRKR